MRLLPLFVVVLVGLALAMSAPPSARAAESPEVTPDPINLDRIDPGLEPSPGCEAFADSEESYALCELYERCVDEDSCSVSSAPLAMVANPQPGPCPGIIDNGVVRLGVNPEGDLNVNCAGLPVSSGTFGTAMVGLRFLPTNGEASAPGAPCEGWGVGDVGTGINGFAADGTCGGNSANLVVNSFSSNISSASSLVTLGNTFQVRHDFFPSVVAFLYEVRVTITNISSQNLSDVRYTRMVDYDVPPNTFSEYITHFGTALSTTVVSAVDRALGTTANPLAAPPTPVLAGGVGDFTDLGPADQGSRMVFSFGPLAAGDSIDFRLFYGAAPDEGQALMSLAVVGADVYSLGQANWNGTGNPLGSTALPGGTFGANTGAPATFMFGYEEPPGPVTITNCQVTCRTFLPSIYTLDVVGNNDACLHQGSVLVPVATTVINGQTVQFNCGNYNPYGNPCIVQPGQDQCDPAIYTAICNSGIWTCP